MCARRALANGSWPRGSSGCRKVGDVQLDIISIHRTRKIRCMRTSLPTEYKQAILKKGWCSWWMRLSRYIVKQFSVHHSLIGTVRRSSKLSRWIRSSSTMHENSPPLPCTGLLCFLDSNNPILLVYNQRLMTASLDDNFHGSSRRISNLVGV